MPFPIPDEDAAVRIHKPLMVLTALARKDTALELIIAPDGTRSLRLVRSGVSLPQVRPVAYAGFAAARDNGWLAPRDDEGLLWGLSTEGRVALRRVRSASGSPAATDNTPTQPAGPATASVDPAESPLAWLRLRKDKDGQPHINALQFEAGERLRADLHFAQMGPRVTASWSVTGGRASKGSGSTLGIDMRDNVVAAGQRVRKAMAAVGPAHAGILLDVCGHLLGLETIERNNRWPSRSGKLMLQHALDALASHYRIPGSQGAVERIASRLRHWGLGDYRPEIDAAPGSGVHNVAAE